MDLGLLMFILAWLTFLFMYYFYQPATAREQVLHPDEELYTALHTAGPAGQEDGRQQRPGGRRQVRVHP